MRSMSCNGHILCFDQLSTGNFMFLRAFSTPIVVVSSADICRDLMEKRSAIYSDKARFAIEEL